MIGKTIVAPVRRGRGRPRKHPKPDDPAGINVVIGKKRRSSSKSATISRAEGEEGPFRPRPPPPQKGGRRRLVIPRWHNKRARSASDALGGSGGGSPVGKSIPNPTPCSSSSSSAGCYRPFVDDSRGDLNGGGVLVFQCLADFEIPGPIPDLADLMSDMTIFQDFFNDIDEFNCG
ncbi:unnamed protein product [Linum trigynum]|uniref:Uncharacterized protein n=1 Tax=Linum trigynum TaxID=586398 RepID=A0AAV2E2H8_9ROSI